MRIIFLNLIYLSLTMNCIAQCDTLVINLKSGMVEKIEISQIQKISFENKTSVKKLSMQSNNLNLIGNFPNPFAEQTIIEFEIAYAGDVAIVIFDYNGLHIKTLKCINCPAGKNTIQWNGFDKNGTKVQSKTYYYVISFGKEFRSYKKMLIVK